MTTNDNQSHKPIILGIIVIGLLCIIRFIPLSDFAIFSTKKADILSDITISKKKIDLPKEKNTTDEDRTEMDKEQIAEHRQDSIRKAKRKKASEQKKKSKSDQVLIEDFSEDDDAMEHFYRKLKNRNRLKRPVRIAFFGDSFTESDIIVGDVREQLQLKYGGSGAGYLPIAPNSSINVPASKHTFSNWNAFSILNHYKKENLFTPIGFLYRPKEGATATYQGVKWRAHLDSVSCFRLLYRNGGDSKVEVVINNEEPIYNELTADNCINELVFDGSIKKATFTVTKAESLEILGVVMEDKKGISVDNYSIRGNTGLLMARIDDELTVQLHELMQYDLIVLQYGVNAVERNLVDYSGYKKAMVKIVKHLQKLLPETSFLLLSTSDRCTREEGEFVTMEGVIPMVKMQKRIAEECGIAFWNMFEAMGGENSMVEFVNNKQGSKDYTHITHNGGKKIATSLVNALSVEAEKYM